MDLSIKRLISFAVFLALLPVPAAPGPGRILAAPRSVPEPEVTCGACLVVDDHGRVLWARSAGQRRSIASTTKMMTALVVRKEVALDEEVTVSAGAEAVPEGKLSLLAGETFNVQELLYGLLLNSSNDAAVALAEHSSGSVDGFVALMNEEAAGLGAKDTHFSTPHGLDAADHYSTASDLALIGAELLGDPVLAEIVGTADATIEGSRRTVLLQNTNLLLETYPGAIGVKTGFTASAGNVLVAAAERKGRRLVAVVLGSADTFEDSRRLLDYGFGVLRRGIVLRAGTPVGGIVFDTLGATGIVAARTVRGLTDPTEVRLRFEPFDALRAPLTGGTGVGTISVSDGTREVASVEAVTTTTLEPAEEQGWPLSALRTILEGAAAILPGEG